jgi:hypothetical protein
MRVGASRFLALIRPRIDISDRSGCGMLSWPKRTIGTTSGVLWVFQTACRGWIDRRPSTHGPRECNSLGTRKDSGESCQRCIDKTRCLVAFHLLLALSNLCSLDEFCQRRLFAPFVISIEASNASYGSPCWSLTFCSVADTRIGSSTRSDSRSLSSLQKGSRRRVSALAPKISTTPSLAQSMVTQSKFFRRSSRLPGCPDLLR